MTIFNLPRHERTPETEVDILLSNLSALYSEIHPDAPPYEFIDTYFKDCYENDYTSGDILAEMVNRTSPASTEGIGKVSELAALVVSCAYCCEALKAWERGCVNEAWTFIVDARFWCGIPLSRRVGRFLEREDKEILSKLRDIASNAKHEKYFARQERFVDEMYASRPWKNKTQAAKEINAKLELYIEKEKLPVESRWNGKKFEEKKDWFDWVLRRLRKKYPPAKQVKLDAQKLITAKQILHL
jgi:hypothetical protein